MPARIRLLCALAAFPAGWAVREAAGGAAGGVVVLALIVACAVGLPRRTALLVIGAGIACFVLVHLVAAVTTVYVGLAVGAVLFAVAIFRTRALAVLAVLLLAGCGSSSGGGSTGTANAAPAPHMTVALDFTPNAVHAPIYAAIREGLDRKAGVRLQIRTPGQSPDSLKDVLTGAADIGVLDIQDLGLAADKGRDIVAVAALVQRPLSAIIALPQIHRPRDLEGQRVGVSGLPSDPAFLRAIMGTDGADFAQVRTVTIGFAAVQSLISRRIVAVPAFWSAEGVALRQRHVPVREFRVDDYGAPHFPEVVLVVKRSTLDSEPRAVHAAVRAIAGGMAAVSRDPGAAVKDIVRAGGGDPALVRAQLAAVTPIMGTTLDPAVLKAWAAWGARTGLLPAAPDVAKTFDVADSSP